MRIKEIRLETHVLEELKNFYTETLKLSLANETRKSFTVRAGYSAIKFTRVQTSDQPLYHFAFNIPENQLPEAKQWLSSRIPLIEKDGQDQFRFDEWNAEAIYFRDPAGNILELIARHNLKNRSDREFSGASLLGVSEIGVPVEDVYLFSRHIQQELNIELWRGDEKQFAAVGDEEGLFIIVPIGRKWFATDIAAESFSLAVETDRG